MEELYVILTRYSGQRRPIPYGELTVEYQRETGTYISPRSWSESLGDLNRHLSRFNLPALSVLVVLAGSDHPSDGFWECSPNVPADPGTDEGRRQEIQRIRELVYATRWPVFLP